MAVDFRSFNCLPEHQGPAFRTWSRILQTATMSSVSPTSPLLSPNSYSNLESSFPKLTPAEDFIPFEMAKNGQQGRQGCTEIGSNANSNGGIACEGKAGLNANVKQVLHDVTALTYAPWKKKSYPENAYGLHLEVKDFYEFMSPTAEEAFMRKSVVQRISDLISGIWPAAKVEVFGSYKTNLYLPTSDIDLVVFGQWEKLPLWTLEKELVNEEIAEQSTIKVLDKASVPIIKLTDKRSNIKVDISFNMETAVKGAELIREFLKEYKVLPQLFLLLKHFLVMRDLNEVFTGGISSYCLMLLTVSFLQMHPRQESKLPNANLGVLLVEFFELYGRNFNYQRTGIKIRNGGCYCSKDEIMKEMAEGQFPSLLCIEDPVSKVIDIGKSSFGIMRVKEAFEYAYNVLESALRNKHYFKINPDSTYLSRILQVPPEIMHYRRWVKENFKLPKQEKISSPTKSESQEGMEIPIGIDIVNHDDFPPLQTANPPPQRKERSSARSSNSDRSESKSEEASTDGADSLYSSVGSDSKRKDANGPTIRENELTKNDAGRIGTTMQDVDIRKDEKKIQECQKEVVEISGAEKEATEVTDYSSPNEDFLDDFILDPYVSWGDICDDSSAYDNDQASTEKDKFGKTETTVPIGNGGSTAWSSDEGTMHSNKQAKRPTHLSTAQAHSITSDERHGHGRRYSHHRRNRRPRSPCEGIGEQDLASARQTRQLIISSPEKPIIKPEKWAREDTKHHSRDHKHNDHTRSSGFDEKHKDHRARTSTSRDAKEHHNDVNTHSKHNHNEHGHDTYHHSHKYGSGHRRHSKRD